MYRIKVKNPYFHGYRYGIKFEFGLAEVEDSKLALEMCRDYGYEVEEVKDIEENKEVVKTEIKPFDLKEYMSMNVKQTLEYIDGVQDKDFLETVLKYEKEVQKEKGGRKTVVRELNRMLGI